jgi:hypothetical protein
MAFAFAFAGNCSGKNSKEWYTVPLPVVKYIDVVFSDTPVIRDLPLT